MPSSPYFRQVIKRHGVASTCFAVLEDNYAQSLSDRRSRHGFPFRIAGQNNVGHDHTQTNVPNRPLRRPSHWPAADRPHADDNARGGWSEHFSVTGRRLSAIVQCSEPFRTNRNAHCSEVRGASKPRAINYVMADYTARMLDDATYEVQRELE